MCFPVFLFGVYMFIIFKQDLNFRSQSKSNVVENVNSLSLLIYVSLDIEYISVYIYMCVYIQYVVRLMLMIIIK